MMNTAKAAQASKDYNNELHVNVISSTSISKKVTQALCHLQLPESSAGAEKKTWSKPAPAEQQVVRMTAQTKVASKLISVVEIAKRAALEGLRSQHSSAAQPSASKVQDEGGHDGDAMGIATVAPASPKRKRASGETSTGKTSTGKTAGRVGRKEKIVVLYQYTSLSMQVIPDKGPPSATTARRKRVKTEQADEHQTGTGTADAAGRKGDADSAMEVDADGVEEEARPARLSDASQPGKRGRGRVGLLASDADAAAQKADFELDYGDSPALAESSDGGVGRVQATGKPDEQEEEEEEEHQRDEGEDADENFFTTLSQARRGAGPGMAADATTRRISKATSGGGISGQAALQAMSVAAPVLTIWLSRRPLQELREKHGEQRLEFFP